MDTDSLGGSVHEAPVSDVFVVRGERFQLDVLDTYYAFEDIAKANAEAGKSHRDVLGEIIKHLFSSVGIELTYAEADWLFDKLGELVAKKKRERADAISAMLTSPSSIASVPSPSPMTSS